MLTLKPNKYPDTLTNVRPMPKQIYVRGAKPSQWLSKPRVAIIGTRKPTAYGQAVTKDLASQLAKRGVVIISGLALGIDSIAHQTTVSSNGCTVAVLPSSINKIYPKSHYGIAESILSSGGSLISEFPPDQETLNFKHAFVARNRIIAGLSHAVVITEATIGSGSLHTAEFALDLGIPVLSVPGSIYSNASQGTNQLLKNGAGLVSSYTDILEAIGLQENSKSTEKNTSDLSEIQIEIMNNIANGKNSEYDMASTLNIKANELAYNLTLLEIKGQIKPLGNGLWVAF